REGARVLRRFLDERLDAYPEQRNVPDAEGGSGLSAYLHFGFVSAHEVAASLFERADWHPGRLGRPSGSREGWWGLPPASEAFIDQLVTWRELGFNAARHLPAYDRYASLPAWALTTLAAHAGDPRPVLYDLPTLAAGETHDPLWNAAQRQLVREGRIHNYLRMLWGKKILQWAPSPEEAARMMIELNNRYALDGRDPNSYSGIFWTLGRYDRAWGPERPIFGKIRYMASENTARKWPVKAY
ncbi:MAG: deoxyribodipyrimidine photolyase, partial [Candidatus Sericytochromatia bacterium]